MAGSAAPLRDPTWSRGSAPGGRTAAPKGPGGEGTRSGAVLHRTAQRDRGNRGERNARSNIAGSVATGCSRPLSAGQIRLGRVRAFLTRSFALMLSLFASRFFSQRADDL